MGDALAISLLEKRGFTASDFARFHPGGVLGKQMFLRVSDLIVNNEVPEVDLDETMEKVIIEISSKRLGATAVLHEDELKGLITDGDLRRMIQKNSDYVKLTAKDAMTANPLTIDQNEMAVEALNLMQDNNITQLPVLNDGKYVGVLHLHDIIKEGIF